MKHLHKFTDIHKTHTRHVGPRPWALVLSPWCVYVMRFVLYLLCIFVYSYVYLRVGSLFRRIGGRGMEASGRPLGGIWGACVQARVAYRSLPSLPLAKITTHFFILAKITTHFQGKPREWEPRGTSSIREILCCIFWYMVVYSIWWCMVVYRGIW